MTPEDAACQILVGEHLGSIRSIHPLAEPARPHTLGALEIETKTGHFAHVRSDQRGVCVIGRGPVPMDTSALVGPKQPTRHWTDLTRELAFAFDGRPVVANVAPLRRAGAICGCLFEFSNGGRFEYRIGPQGPQLLLGHAAGLNGR